MAAALTAQDVKTQAMALGADLAGIPVEAINANPPDPVWPVKGRS